MKCPSKERCASSSSTIRKAMLGMVRAYVRRLGIENVDMAESGREALKQRVEKILGEMS